MVDLERAANVTRDMIHVVLNRLKKDNKVYGEGYGAAGANNSPVVVIKVVTRVSQQRTRKLVQVNSRLFAKSDQACAHEQATAESIAPDRAFAR
jgi:hypothetical protein